MTRIASTAPGACFDGSPSPRPPPLAPPTPRPFARLRSSASQMLWRSLTSPARSSSATAPRLPDAIRRRIRAPDGQETSRFPRKELERCQGLRPRQAKPSPRWVRDGSCCLPTQGRRRRPELPVFRGSMAGLRLPLPTLRRRLAMTPHGRGRRGAQIGSEPGLFGRMRAEKASCSTVLHRYSLGARGGNIIGGAGNTLAIFAPSRELRAEGGAMMRGQTESQASVEDYCRIAFRELFLPGVGGKRSLPRPAFGPAIRPGRPTRVG